VSDWLLAFATCLLFVWAGRPWTQRVAGSRPGRWARHGLSYLCGTALVSLAMLGVAFVGLPVNRWTLAAAFLIVRVAGRGAPAPPERRPLPGRRGAATLLPLAAAAATLGFGMLQAFRLGGIDSIDFLKAWGLKGVAVLDDHSLDFSRLSGPHLFYPLEVSNTNGAVLLVMGHVNDSVLRLSAALFALALAAVMWWLLRLVMPPAPAAAAIALAVMTPEFTNLMTNGLADLVLASYVTVCVLGAYLWLLDGGSRYAALSGFAAGAAAWTKLEGTVACAAVLVAVLVVRRAWRTPGVGVWLKWFAVFIVPWQVFQRIHDIPPNRSHFKTLYLHPLWIIDHVARTLAETSHWGLFWPLCLGLIALTVPLWWNTPLRLLAAVTLPNLVLTLGAYVTHYRAGQANSVEATAHRLYLHIAPSLAVMAVAGATVAIGALRERPPAPDTEPA
jgi:Dolichyl-phosphate-mannose-protein mannosyltransferase